jgi:hypothetical protein
MRNAINNLQSTIAGSGILTAKNVFKGLLFLKI